MCIICIFLFFSGGLEAVTYTDVLQCGIMLIGAVILTILGILYNSYVYSMLLVPVM